MTSAAINPITGKPFPRVIRLIRTNAAGADLGILGHARQVTGGWMFIPSVSGRKPSRKVWSDWESCLPRWVRYPDGCRSEAAPSKGVSQ